MTKPQPYDAFILGAGCAPADVTGWLGGYNFQSAWSSAVAAGKDL